MSKIVLLKITDYMGAEAVEIAPDGSELVIIGGDNGAGKSSVLNAVEACLRGGKWDPKDPIRHGSDKAGTELHLSGGWVLKRSHRINKAGKRVATLKATAADGSSLSQAAITERLSRLMSPMAFAAGETPADDRRRSETLREIVGLDLTEIDKEIESARLDRLLAGRERDKAAGHLAKMPHDPTAPMTLVDVAELGRELAAAEAARASNERATVALDDMLRATEAAKIAAYESACAADDWRRQGDAARDALGKVDDELESAIERARADKAALLQSATARMDEEIEAARNRHSAAILRAKLGETEAVNRAKASAEERRESLTVAESDARSRAESLSTKAVESANKAAKIESDRAAREAELAAAALLLPDLTEIEERIAAASELNSRIQINIRRQKAADEAAEKRAEWQASHDEVLRLDSRRSDMIAAVKMPIDGLGLDAEGGVVFRGIPFAQVEESRRIQISFALAVASDPEIRVFFIRDGNRLGKKRLAELRAYAAEHDAQVLIEWVEPRKDLGAYIIEDGTHLLEQGQS